MLYKVSSLTSNLDKTRRIRPVFARTNFKKRHCSVLRSEYLYLKYIFIKVLLIYSQRCSLKMINLHFNNLIVKLSDTMNYPTPVQGL